MKELSVMNNYFGLGLDAKIAYKFNTTREKNPAQYKYVTERLEGCGQFTITSLQEPGQKHDALRHFGRERVLCE